MTVNNEPQNRRRVDGFRPRTTAQPMPRATDVRPPIERPAASPTQPQTPMPTRSTVPSQTPTPSSSDIATNSAAPRLKRKKRWPIIITSLLGLLVIALVAAFVWYRHELTPVSGDTTKQRVTVESGIMPDEITSLLKQHGLIRSERAFSLYLMESGARNDLKAGVYRLSPSQSSSDIVKELTSGQVTESSIMFYPGAVLDVGPKGAANTSVTHVLQKAGFSDAEIERALSAKYNQPALFADKPAGTSLEGYIYGDTYNYSDSASAEDVIKLTLDQFAKVVAQNDLVNAYKAQGLDLYQGITLASIVQREVSASGTDATEDQKIVAQIFLRRLKENHPLGSDVTYLYGAAQQGATPSPDLNSPYNTRKVTGLPPGPIAVPGLGALKAVAQPASSDYLYFLSGDDGKTYFAHTEDEHNANIVNHCQKKCSES